jgi:Fe-S cluster assembly scaffold protein SufB
MQQKMNFSAVNSAVFSILFIISQRFGAQWSFRLTSRINQAAGQFERTLLIATDEVASYLEVVHYAQSRLLVRSVVGEIRVMPIKFNSARTGANRDGWSFSIY